MKVSYVTSAHGGGNVTDVAAGAAPLTWPSIVAGDLAVLFWAYQSTQTNTDPSGFTLLANLTSTTGSCATRLFYKICTGSETGNISLVNGVANRQSAVLGIYRNAHKSAPIVSGDWTATAESVAGTSHASPTETLNVADCGVLTFIGERATTGSTTYSHSAFTKRVDSGTDATGAGGTIVGLADDGMATNRANGASVSPGNWTSSFSTAQCVMWTVMIRPREYEGWGVDL